jgi:hypothetical protein
MRFHRLCEAAAMIRRAVLAVTICLMTVSAAQADPAKPAAPKRGIVYLVIAIDTEPYQMDPAALEQIPKFDNFAYNDKVAQTMEPSWRGCHIDSFGDSLTLTWFVMSHEMFCHVPDGSCTMVLDTLLKFQHAVVQFGDQVAWHYHHADWTDPNEDGVSHWNQLLTFDRTTYTNGVDVGIAERMLNHLLIDRGYFPGAFRTGWAWENDAFSRWVEEIIPFDLSADPPHKNTPKRREPLRNQYEWSRAPKEFRGYHPDAEDYQTPGKMHRWIFRTNDDNKAPGWQKIFQLARLGKDQMAAITCHSYDNIALLLDTMLPNFMHQALLAEVQVKFGTASAAAAAITGKSSLPAPPLRIDRIGDTLFITSDTLIYQPAPYCAIKTPEGLYRRAFAHSLGKKTGRWFYALEGMRDFVFACAVTSRSGLTAVAKYEDVSR